MLPVVAIIGRPNVGKSRLFNRIAGRHKAIVDDTAGVTRDRHYAEADWRGQSFLIVDTGGLIPGSEEPLNKKVWGQAFHAIGEADLLIAVLDGNEGVTPVDQVLVNELRKIGKPCLYAVNKVDAGGHEKNVFDFASLGVEPLIAVSAEHGRGISDLMEAIYKEVDKRGLSPPVSCRSLHPSPSGALPLGQATSGATRLSAPLRLAIIGRPNVGKSTLLNHLAKEERVVVHEIAGTTRDPIDIIVERKGRQYLFVDTAGIKRKRTTKGRLEKFSVITSLKAIDESALVLLLIDGPEGLTHQDLQLAYHVWEAGKGLLILANKWDLVKGSAENYIEELRFRLGELRTAPILCISAKTGKNCGEIWDWIQKLNEGMEVKVKTPLLNDWIENMVAAHEPPHYKGRNVRIYYGTQVRTFPPHIVLFTNAPDGIPASYARYLKNRLGEMMGLEGIPLRLSFRSKGK